MSYRKIKGLLISVILVIISTQLTYAQIKSVDKFRKASKKIEKGFENNNKDTVAQGYFDLGENYYQKREFEKSETYFKKAKSLFEKIADVDGIARSSRALARVQEELHKNKEAKGNYYIAQKNNEITGNQNSMELNRNDVSRLSLPDSVIIQKSKLQQNINLGISSRDTTEIISNYSKLAGIGISTNQPDTALAAYNNAYRYSKNDPANARLYNQLITNVLVNEGDFGKAIETKKALLKERFVLNSTLTTASEITSLADIYILKNDDSTAIRLLRESYAIAAGNGHTLEAKRNIEKLDSIFQNSGKQELSLKLYKEFLGQLPGIIEKDSAISSSKLVTETEGRIKILETEKALKDDLISKKNILNFWLTGSVIVLLLFIIVFLYMLKKLNIRNKKIALQSLRREMNPHFIFNSLNSINQFIANNNEMEANQYLTKFSTLMRNVMENSKEDFVLFSKEIELLTNYLELERSRFPDKFNFEINIDDALLANEQLYIPGMLIQPHLENAVWHGLRYIDDKGLLKLNFTGNSSTIEIRIEDNGIGIAGSKKSKTSNQQKHNGRGISNTLERIRILNELYRQDISCVVEDIAAPGHGVKVTLIVPFLKSRKNEN